MGFFLKALIVLSLLLSGAGPAGALGPMYSYHDLVAGEGTAGMENGFFYSALFHTPLGMTVDPVSNQLFVADSDNHCLRVIDLSEQNKVSTLVGTGKAGGTDGSFAVAAFNKPSALVLLPRRRIVVYDSGNARLRLVDLDKKSVATLAGTGESGSLDGNGIKAQVGPIWNMAYLESQDALYFSEPESGTLRKMDMKILEVSTLLRHDPQIPNPAALCVKADKLYAADRNLPQVYELLPDTNRLLQALAPAMTPAATPVYFTKNLVANAEKVMAMAWTGNSLYALEANPNTPVACLAPAHSVDFISTWGELLKNPGQMAFFNDVQSNLPLALVPDPSSERKFFLRHPVENMITSFRDLSFLEGVKNESYNSNGLMDFEYPLKKPTNVFRILLTGDSHIFHNTHGDVNAENRMELPAKRLELALNTAAAMEDAPMRFEVLTQALNSHEPLNIWTYYLTPDIVKKYDVDLVLMMQTSINYGGGVFTYFERPLTADEIPAQKLDPEYLLKPWTEKVKKGLPKELYDLCLKKKLVEVSSQQQLLFKTFDEMDQDPEVLALLAKMYSRPIQMLKGKITSVKTSSGAPVQFAPCLVPLPALYPFRHQRPFWNKVKDELGPPFLDMEAPMTSLRVGFFPFTVMDGYDHFNSDGNLLVAFMLAYELIHDKMIPFDSVKK